MSEPIRFPTVEEIPESARVDGARWSMQWLCDGEIRTFHGPGADVLSPICVRQADGSLTRAVIGRTPLLDRAAALEALAAARRAWDEGRGEWPTMRVARRIGAMERFAELMGKAREEVVRLLMWEIGKTRKDAESEFDRTLLYVRDTVEALKELDRSSARFVMEEGFLGQIRRSPLGVVLCMGPFNYPLNETYTTLIPALIMGNAVVCKVPKYGALLHAPLFAAMREAFPPGVVNVIYGDGPTTVGPIMESGEVDVLAFIGTSRVVNILKRQHPQPNRLRSITGLEAKNPAIVLPDADLDVAVKECVSGALSFNGQRCTGIKLIFVHRSIEREFLDRLSAAVDALKAGMPWDQGAQLTPLPEDRKTERLAAYVEDAVSKGARVVNGGGAAHGTFFRPAVVHPVKQDMKLYTEEQFGPVLPVATFDDVSEIDHFMRLSEYGQQVALFGRDRKKMAFLVDALVNQVSRINLNSQCRRGPDTFPFTGRKDSAEGTLSVSDALRAFSIRTVVATASNDENKSLVSDIIVGRLSSFLSTDYIF
ncbi:MAG: aldehyde dehydrogenase family protein [Deltaproteobacteria bacterium]|nr:aldehyde dehydrogenase family protein [Deltaproteobacteria bacterium]